MDSSPNVNSKINDAMVKKLSNSMNVSKESTMGNLFNDQKRVIKKMIVMDTSKLKGLGIESVIKNAMSKLEKGKDDKSTVTKPTLVASKLIDPVIKRESDPTIVKTTDARPGMVVKLENQPIRVVRHTIRPTFPSSKSTNTVDIQSTSVTSMPMQSAIIVKNEFQTSMATVQSSMSRVQPIPIINSQQMPSGSIQNNVEQVSGPVVIKTEPTVASDGKKIKILSNVSLNNTKAKLLEIDKISSKNLKLTNVIKGTDDSSLHAPVQTSNSVTKPIMSSTSIPLKGQVDKDNSKNFKIINVIKRTQESLSQLAVPPAVSSCSTSTHSPIAIKSKNLKFTNVREMVTTLPSQTAVHSSTSTNKPVMSASSVHLKAKIDNTSSQKLKLITKGVEDRSSQSIIISGATSRPALPPCSKAESAEIDKIKSKNLKIINVVKEMEKRPLQSAVHMTSTTKKPVTSLYSTSPNSEIDGISFKNLKYTNVMKGTGQSAEQSAVHTTNSTAKRVMPQGSTSASVKLLPKKLPVLPTNDNRVEIMKPAKPKRVARKKRILNVGPCPIDEKPFSQDGHWATNNPRTYERHNVKRLLSAKIMEKSRMLDESVLPTVPCKMKNEVQCDEDTISSDEVKCAVQCDVTPVKNVSPPIKLVSEEPVTSVSDVKWEVQSDVTRVKNVSQPMKIVAEEPLTLTPVPTAEEPSDTNTVTPTRKIFYGFSNEELVESATAVDHLNSVASKRRLKEAIFVSYTDLDVGHERKSPVDCDKEHWVLNPETGVLEENINADKVNVTMEESLTPSENNSNSLSKPVTGTTPMKEISLITPIIDDNESNITPNTSKSHNDTQSTITSPGPSKTPATEDADDEISDIDLAHRSKSKLVGSTTTPAVKNRRAILLKSIELHRKAFNPATTDEESELSLCVRPPRPKLRKYRHNKQTMEQLRNQQNAHVSLLKRFNRGDSDCDAWDDDAMEYFTNGVLDRIEVLESQVKCCFDRHTEQELNVEKKSLSEQSVLHVNPSTENNESMKFSECSVVNSQFNSVVACELPLQSSTLPDNAVDVEGQSKIHEVTIEKDTFLVTEIASNCDKINHQPIILKIKLEKDAASPKPSSSLKRKRIKKSNEPTRRKKRKRQSLVEMLAQCVDQNTLKSVILAHEKQKCDFSSSIDSDSEDDSDDVVSKIFRTVCTIDLCDDDDETIHEDVLQYMDENQELEDGCENDGNSMCPSDADESQDAGETQNTQPYKLSDDKSQKAKLNPEPSEIAVKIPEQECMSNPPVDEDLSRENIIISKPAVSDIAVPILNKHPKVNGIQYPSRSRKRKRVELIQEQEEAVATAAPIPNESIRTRPIFDNFDSPEILTTKRARKSKSYVDLEIPNIDAVKPKTRSRNHRNQRASNRKVNAKCVENDKNPQLEPMADKRIDRVEDVADIHITEPEKPSAVIDVPETNTEPKFDSPSVKKGRGPKQAELATLNVAEQYICGNCKEEVLAKNWTKHTKYHYGLSWRVDIDSPLDLDNMTSMGSKMINYMRRTNLKTLKCKKCNVEKKSAIGYLSHVEMCGLSPDEVKNKLVKCDYCPSMIRSCSVRSHLCSGLKRLLQKEKEATKECDISTEECYNDVGRAVRRSAQKALSSFKDLGKPPETKIEDYVERVHKISNKQLRKLRMLLNENETIGCVRNGCSFTAVDLTTMLSHFNTCVLINGETFYCNRCNYGPDSRDVVEEHIKATHSLGVIEAIDDKDFSDSDDEAEIGEESSESEGESGDDESLERDDEQYDDGYDDDGDGWNDKGYKKKRLRDWGHNEVMLNSCLDRKVLNEHSLLLKSYSSGSFFHPALEWTQDFRDKHFSSQDLFPFATPNTFSILNTSLTEPYMPKVSMSNQFLVKNVHKYKNQFGSTAITKSDEWKSLKRFEATSADDSIVLFTGGPILSMAWLPVPDDYLSQILAVCCRNAPNEDILMNNTQQTKCLIQIWNFNKLKNSQMRQVQTPHLLYSIAYDYGPIVQMEFCPSGGFTEDRLGLLAVSSYDGHVDILALPKNFTCDNSTIENLVFVIKPSLILCCDLEKPLGELLTKLVWSQSKGHTKLAAGYANGLVAIWNLKNLQSPHTSSKTNGIPTLLPTDLFFAACKAITLLEFHHDEKNEARWLVAGSHDRKVKFFDTHNVFIEISSVMAHSRISAGCWPMHWTTFLFGTDNAYSLKVSGIVVKQPLDIGCRTGTFYSCIGSTCDISFNNWLNSYVFVTSYGDIHVGYLRQMLSAFADARRHRSILGYTDAVDINQLNSIKQELVVDDDTPVLNEPQPVTSSTDVNEHVKDISYPSINGIVFCDFQNPLPAVTSPSYDKIRAPPMDTFNMVKVNRILFNPNVSAYKLYALGYESGFVRINQLLPK